MGSNAIAALAITTIGILEDATDKRFIKTVQRGAPPLDRTELVFDKFRRVSLGKSDCEKREQRTLVRKDELKASILEFVAAYPGTQQTFIKDGVTGKAKAIGDKLKDLESSGFLQTTGKERKGNPKLYFVADIPVEKAAA